MDSKRGLTLEDRVALIASLKNGLGLTVACSFIHLHPRDVSKFILENDDLHLECIDAIKFSAKALLVISNTYLEKHQFEKWKQNNSFIKDFIPDLILWESYCKKEDLTVDRVTKAVHIYRTIDECATAVGYTKNEFITYITSNPALSLYLSQKNIYNL